MSDYFDQISIRVAREKMTKIVITTSKREIVFILPLSVNRVPGRVLVFYAERGADEEGDGHGGAEHGEVVLKKGYSTVSNARWRTGT
jgi:hypothetical protein